MRYVTPHTCDKVKLPTISHVGNCSSVYWSFVNYITSWQLSFSLFIDFCQLYHVLAIVLQSLYWFLPTISRVGNFPSVSLLIFANYTTCWQLSFSSFIDLLPNISRVCNCPSVPLLIFCQLYHVLAIILQFLYWSFAKYITCWQLSFSSFIDL
jgi:hypothetical protein